MHIFTKVCLIKKNVDIKLPTHTNPDDVIHFNMWNLDLQQKLNFIFFGYVFLYELVSKTGALGMLNFVEFDLTVDKYCFTVYSSKSKLLINFWFFFTGYTFMAELWLSALWFPKRLSTFSLSSLFWFVGHIRKGYEFFFNCGTRNTY